MTASLDKALRDLATTTIRVQPLAPEQGSLTGALAELIAELIVLAVYGWTITLATSAAHGYWPGIPEVGYWQALIMLVGLSGIGHAVRGPAWKWARR
jgi:hypothetical protein